MLSSSSEEATVDCVTAARSILNSIMFSLPVLSTPTVTGVPASPAISVCISAIVFPRTFSPSTLAITSPESIPAFSAGESANGFITVTLPFLSSMDTPIPTNFPDKSVIQELYSSFVRYCENLSSRPVMPASAFSRYSGFSFNMAFSAPLYKSLSDISNLYVSKINSFTASKYFVPNSSSSRAWAGNENTSIKASKRQIFFFMMLFQPFRLRKLRETFPPQTHGTLFLFKDYGIHSLHAAVNRRKHKHRAFSVRKFCVECVFIYDISVIIKFCI